MSSVFRYLLLEALEEETELTDILEVCGNFYAKHRFYINEEFEDNKQLRLESYKIYKQIIQCIEQNSTQEELDYFKGAKLYSQALWTDKEIGTTNNKVGKGFDINTKYGILHIVFKNNNALQSEYEINIPTIIVYTDNTIIIKTKQNNKITNEELAVLFKYQDRLCHEIGHFIDDKLKKYPEIYEEPTSIEDYFNDPEEKAQFTKQLLTWLCTYIVKNQNIIDKTELENPIYVETLLNEVLTNKNLIYLQRNKEFSLLQYFYNSLSDNEKNKLLKYYCDYFRTSLNKDGIMYESKKFLYKDLETLFRRKEY